MNSTHLNRPMHTFMRDAWHYAVWMVTAILLTLFAHTHAQSSGEAQTFNVETIKSRPLPFEAKLAPGALLVASRALRNSNFAQSVILLIAHDQHGAQGIVINRPSPIQLSRVLPDLPASKAPSPYIFLGGPVDQMQLRILVHTDQPSDEMQSVIDNVYLSGSPEVLKQLMHQPQPASRFRVFAGYAGWGPGQLEREIERGGWHIFDAEVDAIFDPSPSSVWPRLIRKRDLKWM